MTDLQDPPVEMEEPWPCRHVGGEGCEGCDSRNKPECPDEEEVMDLLELGFTKEEIEEKLLARN